MENFNGTALIKEFNVSREIIDALKDYQNLVIKWNQKVNLISNNSTQNFWERHIIDSLQLLRFIENKNIHLIDIGSGAGFPGIVLSISGIKKVTLIDSDSKKTAFSLQAASLSSNKVDIVNERIEEVTARCEILTSRACASVSNIFKLCKNIVVSNKYLLLKGENYKIELEEAKREWIFNYNIKKSITSTKSVVIEIKDLANRL